MLIPLTAGGLVIGRKGANIAALLEASGAKVTLGQKADVKVHERLVTVQGKLTAATKVTTRCDPIPLGLSVVTRTVCGVCKLYSYHTYAQQFLVQTAYTARSIGELWVVYRF